MCGHKQIGIWETSKITVVDSNDVVNHWFVTGAINIPRFLSDKINGPPFVYDRSDVTL